MKNRLSFKLAAFALLAAVLMAPFAVPGASSGLGIQAMRIDGDAPITSTNSTGISTNVRSTKYPHSRMKERIAEYQKTNKEVIGWLTIPNTNINYPVNYHDQSNKYYMYRTWDGVDYPNTNYLNYVDTAVYADYRVRFGDTWKGTSRNIVLYGHNWTNLRNPLDIGNVRKHTMFAQLPSYTDIEFARANPYIYFSTGENEGVWKVFSVAYTEDSNNFFYNNPRPDAETLDKIVGEWQQRTLHNFDVDVNSNDRILTLSTCTRQYDAGKYQRFVVVARLLREGESENDAVTITKNPNPKQPQFQ